MRYYIYYISFIFLFLGSPWIIKAQKPSFIFNQLTVEHGLSENTIRAITEDRRGFMWFCTESGLNKFDGKNFTIYKFLQKDSFSISNNIPRFFLNDSKGRLWIATRQGLNLYDHVYDRFYHYRNSKYKALHKIQSEIEAIEEDKFGNIWAIEVNGGLYKISSLDKNPEYYHLNSKTSQNLFLCIKADHHGNIMIGTRAGLVQFDVQKKSFNDLSTFYGRNYQVNCIFNDKEDKIYLGTSEGLKQIDPKKGTMKEYFNDPKNRLTINKNYVEEIIQYTDGNLLLALDGTGIDYFDKSKEKFYHYTFNDDCQLNSNNVTSVFLDSKSNFWVGTFLNGINYSNEASNLFVYQRNNFDSPSKIKQGIVTGFLMDSSDNFWVSTDGGGLFLKKKNETDYINYNNTNVLPSNIIMSQLQYRGEFWFSTYDKGLIHFDPPKKNFKNFKKEPSDYSSIGDNRLGPLAVYQDQLWVGLGGLGLDIMDLKTKKFTHHKVYRQSPDSLPSEWVQNFIIDKNNGLWLATFNGLCNYQPELKTFRTYQFSTTEGNKSRDYINDFVEDENNNILLGTKGGGLIIFNKIDKTFKVFTTEDGLVSNDISVICMDDYSNLWMGSNNGITKFNLVTLKGTSYNINDGVPPAAFYRKAKFKTQDGKIYFGSSGGYVVINPTMAKTNTRIPPVFLTKIKIGGKPVEIGPLSPLKKYLSYQKELVLTSDQNALNIQFASLNFNNANKNKYSYILEGFDKEWSAPDPHNFATYTNIDPGKYTFKVIGSNNDGIWNKNGASIQLTILPPWYMTWWCRTLIGVVTILSIFLFNYLRHRSIKKRNRFLEEEVIKRTMELKEANSGLAHLNKTKDKFFSIIGHDLKGPVGAIIALIQMLKEETALKGDENQKAIINHIDIASQKVNKLILGLLEWARTQTDQVKVETVIVSVLQLLNDNRELLSAQANQKQIDIHIESNEEHLIFADYNMVTTVIRNILSNSIKYTHPGGSILLRSTCQQDGFITLSIKDTGIGMSEETLQELFSLEKRSSVKGTSNELGTGLGMIISKEFTELNKGKIYAESTPGKGSTFFIRLPKANVYKATA